MSSTDHDNTWKLLHPELLSRDELLSTLRERHVKVDENISHEKEQLVELFKRVAMPQAQRSCFKDKTTKMEVENTQEGKPTVSASKLHFSQNGNPSRQNIIVQGTSSCATTSSSSCSIMDVTQQLKKAKIKRSASQMSGHCTKDGTNLPKRERITWP
ncbi:uncharacterized protein LOC130701681 [Daphnia carinata]|uniref:uncharacterized protein LOC130701681 n=1 Tax=Daphnia carinata TaxID=120202 RepID=UPI002579B900|nr:uncharacterized protein LOC130701681 [Daphnia carinata]